MGYYVNISETNAVIPAMNLDEAFRRLKLLNAPDMDVFKSGGSWGGGARGKTESWWSWMAKDYDKTATSAADILSQLGFDTTVTDAGLSFSYYDSKTGDEDIFLYVIRDLFKPGSFIRWTGEDGAMWEHSFDGTDMLYREGGWTISYPVPLEIYAYSYGFETDGQRHLGLRPRGSTPRENEYPDALGPILQLTA